MPLCSKGEVSSTPTNGNIGIAQSLEQLCRFLGADHFIGIDECDQLAGGCVEALQDRAALAKLIFEYQGADSRTISTSGSYNVFGTIDTTVQNHYELPTVLVLGCELGGVCTERMPNAGFLVVGGNDDGDVHVTAFYWNRPTENFVLPIAIIGNCAGRFNDLCEPLVSAIRVQGINDTEKRNWILM